jgi:hypothetical protein
VAQLVDKYYEELKRQRDLQNQLEEQMCHQESEKQREEHLKNQMSWLNKVEQ